MIIYNETFVIDDTIEQEWLQWIQKEHIPAVLATGLFDNHQILAVLDSPNEGATYCIQYMTDDINKYHQFSSTHVHRLHTLHNQQFENRFVLFNSLMKTIN
ncbi:DUF4286 family protein [Mucilaginibacter robiniae]|uniref:DUF4286 family protein n=1 Tax=Mucilaginibacter robiniae TaxID=2728022 RepID=A0A7L5DY07_9SPHI|nr:DUF4286 family protein [Mucilaginibacter robiniae]QJD95651.1 DUF4286 family protein [Mucilaginibacter robiniae]